MVRWIIHRARWILVLALALSALGAFAAALLYKDLRLDLTELLPSDARSVQDMHRVRGRLVATDSLTLIALSSHPQASRKFMDDLADELKPVPRSLISSVEYRIDRELRFFDRRKALYVDLADLQRIHKTIEDRIRYEEELYNPLNIFSGKEIPEPKLDLSFLRRPYDAKIGQYTRFPEGYYASPDQKIRVMLIYKAGASTEIDRLRLLKSTVEKAVAKLNPRSYAPDLEIHYSGDVENMIEEQAAVLADLKLSTVIVAVLVFLAILSFFRSARATFALLGSVLTGTLWTMAAAYLLVGSLNANSAFLASIVLGNGINFGIILTARYLEERRRGSNTDAAILIATRNTASATWTAALSAGLSYGSLILTGFRGFRQFGIIGLCGMVLCWISAFTVLPALLHVFLRGHDTRMERPGHSHSFLFRPLVAAIARAPWAFLALGTIATTFAAISVAHVTPDDLETDLTRLRSRWSIEHGSGKWNDLVDQVFKRYLSPVAILPNTPEEAEEIARRLREVKAKEGPGSMIDSVLTLEDFIPKDQKKKIALLKKIRATLPRRIIRMLSPRERALAKSFLTPEALHPIRVKDLPPMVVDRFREVDGTVGRIVLVTPPAGAEIRKRENLFHFVKVLREAADSVRPGIPVAGTLPVTADMFSSVMHDGPRATLTALVAVSILVTLLFRDRKRITWVLLALYSGVLWLAGLAHGIGEKVNFLNFIALPITFGIGVDYGVNIVQRYVLEGRGSVRHVVASTGAAVALCSLTTIIGYSSLLVAQNMAFYSFGLLAVLGEITCLSAALSFVPAILELRDRGLRNGKSAPPRAQPSEEFPEQGAA